MSTEIQYSDLLHTAAQVDAAVTAVANLSAVALSGAYADLTGKPNLAAVATSGNYADLSGKPGLSAVATTGAYADLTGKPSLAAVAQTGQYTDLTGRPNLADVATSGAYADLTGKPTVDASMSASSTNAVQNKAVSAALAEKAGAGELIAEATARAAADTALQTAVGTKASVSDIYGLASATISPPQGETADLNEYKTPGIYRVPNSAYAGRIENSPVTGAGYLLRIAALQMDQYFRQEIYVQSHPEYFFVRHYRDTNGWTPWYKYEGTAVIPDA